MIGKTLESNDTLESLLKVFSTPGHNVDGVAGEDQDVVAGSDIASWCDVEANTAASDITYSRDVIPDPNASATDPALRSLQEGTGGLAVDQMSTTLRSDVNKISGFAEAKWGLPQDRDDSPASDRRPSSRPSNVNKISKFTATNSSATHSAGALPHDGDGSFFLDQSSSSLLSNVNRIPLHAASASDDTDVAASKSACIDVDAGQFTYESNPHAQNLISHQPYLAYGNADGTGSEYMALCSNMYMPATPVPFVQTPDMHATQRTTVLLRNIPKNYNTSRVMELLNSVGFKGMYDFVDVPTNRVSKTTGGFAIVNLIHPAYAPFFWKKFDGYNQWTCKSRNTCRVVWYEQLQGLHQIMCRYKNLLVVNKGIPNKARPWLLNEGEWVQF